MARPVTLFTGTVGRPSAGGAGGEGRGMGIRRARAGLLGRSFRGRQGARGRLLLRTEARPLEEPRTRSAGRSRTISLARPFAITRSTNVIRGSCRPEIWGDGDPEGVRQRAAEGMKDTARAAARFGVKTVNGFTGSSIWHTLAGFPPVPPEMIDAGYRISPTAGTRSSMSLTRSGSGSRWRCTRARSHTTSGPRRGRWKRSIATASGSTSTRATSTGSSSTRLPSSSSSRTRSSTSIARNQSGASTDATGSSQVTCPSATCGEGGTSSR